MLKLRTTVAACLALVAIGGIIAGSSQSAKSDDDAKSNSSPSGASKTASPVATAPTPFANESAKAGGVPPEAEPSATAQIQTTGVPGSPSATTTIGGKQLPPPDPKFGGVIKEKASESKAWWAPRVVPPKGAPNVLLDHDGRRRLRRARARSAASFRHRHWIASRRTGCVTRISTPRRSARPRARRSITGRNHHVAGFGVVGEIATGFPGLRLGHQEGERHHRRHPEGQRVRDLVVRQGSQHALLSGDPGRALRPVAQRHGLRVLLWLRRRRHQPVAAEPVPQYDGHLPLRGQSGLEPDHGHGRRGDPVHEGAQGDRADKPFLVYYVPGGTHAPHHPTPEWIKKISDMHLFDGGWNKLRETIFANQKRLGIMPENAKLTPWPKDLPEWDSLSWDEKKLFIKQADVFGAYLAYTDHEIGRVIQAVEDMGQLDNTLIIYISGDNGASAEGMLNGTPNEFTTFNGVAVPVKDQFLWYEFWGSDRTFPHFAAPWSWAMDTPFKWMKQVASHYGGTAQGVAMSWPGHINDAGGIRRQFHHLIDIVPTILEATGIPLPDTLNGIKQRPMDGVSMAYTWDKANANAPSRHTTQYFEMLGNRAIYHDGWIAATTPATLPWELSTAKPPPDVITGYKWELYNVGDQQKEDPTEFNDLAAKMPEKLKQMQDIFYAEAKKFDVLPLDNTTLARWNTPKPNLKAGRTVFTYSGGLTRRPQQRRSEHPEQVVHDYRRGRDPRRRRGRHDRHRRRALRRLWTFPEQGCGRAFVTASRCSSTTCSTSSARSGQGLSWAPASTPSSSTSSPMVRAWAREGRACSPWTVRKWPEIPWNTPPRSRSRRTKPSTSARTRAPASRCWSIATMFRSSSPARSTSSPSTSDRSS